MKGSRGTMSHPHEEMPGQPARGEWKKLSWRAIISEVPNVAALAFNLFCCIVAIVGAAVHRALLCKSSADIKDAGESDGEERGELPKMIRPGYRPPLITGALWGAVGGGLSATCWTVLIRDGLLPTRILGALENHPHADYYSTGLVFVFGFWMGLDRLAGWRRFVGDFLREVHRLVEMKILDDVVQKISKENGGRALEVLDFGGGKGKTAARMKLDPCIGTVESIDIEAHPPHVEKYDGKTIPFADNRFDLAVCLYVFHHIPQTAELIQQLSRKSRRVLIFEDLPEISSVPLVARMTFAAHFLLFQQSVHTHLHHSKPEWRRLLQEEWGFSVLQEFRIPPTAALPYERVAFYCEARERG